MAERKSMMFYFDWMDNMFDGLKTNASVGNVCFALIQYARSGEIPSFLSEAEYPVFCFMKCQIDRDTKKYNDMVERNRQNALKKQAENNNRI